MTAAETGPVPIVVTRFAVRTKAGRAPTPEWIEDRFNLLRRTSLRSLARADVPRLAWVLLADPDRADQVGGLLEQVQLPRGTVHLGLTVGFAPVTRDIAVDPAVLSDHDQFLTFRLDSDDVLLPKALGLGLEAARGVADGTLIDLRRGYRLDLRGGELQHAVAPRWRQGPFLAIRHDGRDQMFDTGGVHTGAREGRSVVTVEEATWIQVIHGGNISNRMPGEQRPSGMRAAWGALPRLVPGWSRDGVPVPAQRAARVLASCGLVTPPSGG